MWKAGQADDQCVNTWEPTRAVISRLTSLQKVESCIQIALTASLFTGIDASEHPHKLNNWWVTNKE